jgi:hypothetical protein
MDKMTREPCDFVKLVLNRMDTNPDEFERYGRWESLCESLERYAGAYDDKNTVSGRSVLWAYDKFEIDLMLAKYRELYRDREYKAMLKNLLMGNEPKTGFLIKPGYQGITPQQLFANTPTTGPVGHVGVTIANTASSTTSNPQIRSMIDDAIEAKMMGFKRG